MTSWLVVNAKLACKAQCVPAMYEVRGAPVVPGSFRFSGLHRHRRSPSTSISLGFAMLITPWPVMPCASPAPGNPARWTPHPLSDIGSEGKDEDNDVPVMPAFDLEPSSPSCPPDLSRLFLVMPFGETWGLFRAGMLRGSRGLRVCGRSWVSGLSLDTCLTYGIGFHVCFAHRRFSC